MKHVAFDVDGVLRNLAPHTIRVYKELFPKFGDFFVDPDKVVGFDHRQNMKSYNKDVYEHFRKNTMDSENSEVIKRIFSQAPSYPEAERVFSRCYNMLSEVGCEVTICTHQKNDLRIMATMKWLSERNFPFDGCTFTKEGNKYVYGVDYLLDDKIENIIQNESQGNIGVLRRRDWNENDLSRVKNHVGSVMEFTKFVIKKEGYNG